MATLDFKLPDVGEGVTEGEIVQWFVAVGDSVAEDDPMVEIMTDKATVTIGAPCDARVERLCFDVGAIAQVGQVILTLELAGASRPPATAVGEIRDQVPGAELFGAKIGNEIEYLQAKALASPATRGVGGRSSAGSSCWRGRASERRGRACGGGSRPDMCVARRAKADRRCAPEDRRAHARVQDDGSALHLCRGV